MAFEIECLDRVLVVGGDEHQQRRQRGLELRRHFQAAHAGHLDIEEHGVGLQACDRGRGFDAVAAFSNQCDIGLLGEPAAQFVARRSFVVDDEDAHHAGAIRQREPRDDAAAFLPRARGWRARRR